MVSVDGKQHFDNNNNFSSELRSCLKVQADVLGPLFLVVMVSVDVKQH